MTVYTLAVACALCEVETVRARFFDLRRLSSLSPMMLLMATNRRISG